MTRAMGLACGLAALALGGSAMAAPPTVEPGRAAVVQALSDCRRIADRDARLACYDKAADALDLAQDQGQVVVIDREQARAVRRQAFGFNIPSIKLFNRGPKEEKVDRLSVKLAGAHRDADGNWAMTTVEDAVWRQTDGQSLLNDPRGGSTLDIRPGLMGSFFCKVDGQSAVRCARSR